MRLIIDIPYEDYIIIKLHKFTWCYWVGDLFEAVKRGKPLDISIEKATEQFERDLENGFCHDRKGN